MRAKIYYALAASVAVVALGAPMAFELWKNRDPDQRYIKVVPQVVAEARHLAEQADGARQEAAPATVTDKTMDATAAQSVAELTVAQAPRPPVASAPATPPLVPALTFAVPTPALAKAKKEDAQKDTGLTQGRVEAPARQRLASGEGHVMRRPAQSAELAAAGEVLKQGSAPAESYRQNGADAMSADSAPQQAESNRDRHPDVTTSPIHRVADEPVSTFSIDVDTASYAFARRSLNAGRLPQHAAVRVEEMINYFPYDYPRPDTTAVPFRPTVTITPSPWAASNKLVHIAIKGYDIQRLERPRANIVLLVDVSGSMSPQDRLPLLKNAYRLLIDELQPQDMVSIVTYASGVTTALEPTRVEQKARIIAAIDRLGAGGGTAGADGLQRAYQLAQENFDTKAVNRIILGTDGDFNLGISDVGELKHFIERKRATGIYLSVLGVGHDNYNDELMQALAQNGNGTAAYIDTLGEARKVLAEEVSSTLFPIARDVKIQIEFNPAAVSDYRLIGYETRALKREDFNNDKVDAGDIGSGHTVTAIYEITPRGAPGLVDDLRYGADKRPAGEGLRIGPGGAENEYGFLKLRYKLPDEDTSHLLTVPVTRDMEVKRMEDAPRDVRFSVAVAAFGQLLQGAPYLKDFGYTEVLALAGSARGEDAFGYRAEFMNLVRLAKSARP